MTLDEMYDELDDIQEKLEAMSSELEAIDKSDLSAQHQLYLRESIRLMRSGQSYVEEAASYLELD